MSFLGLFTIVCAFRLSFAIVDYCETDNFNSTRSTNGIQFTKELSSSEYAVTLSFKSLHCCAKGYRSIEWFKDGKAYPWAGDVSSFILYPESANQTVYSQALGSVDTGNYTCTVANDSRTVSHTVTLTVFDMKNYMDLPLSTYKMPAEQSVRIGQTARLFCEAFVGRIDLPDATIETWWERPGFNMSSPEGQRYHQRQVYREEGQVVGSYLTVHGVGLSDMGEYICSVSNTEDQVLRLSTVLREEVAYSNLPTNKIPWLKMQFVIISLLLFALLAVVYNRFALSALLYFKLRCSRKPIDDGKVYDVVVCFSPKDADFAAGVLAASLQSHYNHTLTLCPIVSATGPADLKRVAGESRRLLVVLSPSLVGGLWSPAALCPLLHLLTDLHPHVICVFQQTIQGGDFKKTDKGMVLRKLLAKCSVVEWRTESPAQVQNSWSRLRLALPPPLLMQDTNEPNSAPANTNSLGVLV